MQDRLLSPFLLGCLATGWSAGVFAAAPVASAEQPLWLLEQPQPGNPMQTARLPGLASVLPYQSPATLMLSCHPGARTLGLELQIAATELGFAVDAFEGPDATAHGPLRLALGAQAGHRYAVNGAFRQAGRYQVGTVFAFGMTPAAADLTAWMSDAARGETLRLSLSAAEPGQPALTGEFRLPGDPAGLRQALSPCLTVATP
ncbi:MAG: hypothetical protein ABWY06_22825 [Pseudomonas sp.]|uniref:hypothetical protein n=1 Tax=Pseudomonas sp. TaxID=306 RepID=UPI00339381E4